jgi:hypothetical protein
MFQKRFGVGRMKEGYVNRAGRCRLIFLSLCHERCDGVPVTIIPPPDPKPEQRRRSQRVRIRIPLLVRTLTVKHPTPEKTHTVEVNAHGALILLATEVAVDQFIILTNATTGEELQSRVVSLGPSFLGKTQVRIEFIKPSPRFWGLPSPPKDWFESGRPQKQRHQKPEVPGQA